MKRVFISIFMIAAVLIAAEGTIFSGTWQVEDEGISITFSDSGKVSYDSEDESVVGDGKFSFTDTTLTADIINDEMTMRIVYAYENKNDVVKVQTIAVVVEGDIHRVTRHRKDFYFYQLPVVCFLDSIRKGDGEGIVAV